MVYAIGIRISAVCVGLAAKAMCMRLTCLNGYALGLCLHGRPFRAGLRGLLCRVDVIGQGRYRHEGQDHAEGKKKAQHPFFHVNSSLDARRAAIIPWIPYKV